MTSSPRSDADPAVRTRIRRQETIAEFGQRALETDSLDELLRDASTAVADTLETEYASVLESHPDDETALLRQGVGWRDGLVGSATVSTDPNSQVGYTLRTEHPVVVDEFRTEDRFGSPELLTDHDIVSGITVTIGSGADPWGVLETYTTESREFTEYDANFVKSIAGVLTSAIEHHQTEQSRRAETAQSPRMVEDAYDRITDGFFALDEDWEFTHANERAAELLGASEDELLGTNLWNAFPNMVGTEFEDRYREAVTTQESVSMEAYYEPSRTWFRERIYPSETGLSVYFRDVTDRKHLTQELEKTFDRITDAFIGLDREWKITYVNERGSEILDPDDQGLVGKNFWDPFEPALGTTFEDEYRTAMETQEPTSFEEYYPPLGVWFEVHAYPSESGLSIYFRDATERKERERELQRTERRFEAIFEDPNILVGLLEPDGRVLDINQTAMEYIDADLEDVTDEPFWETPWWGESESVQSDVREWTERAASGEYVDFEADLTQPNGERYTLNGVFRPVTDDDGDVVSIIVSDRDVTERKRRERQLKKSEQRHRTLAENFPNGIVTMFDDDLRYTLAAGRAFDDLPVSSSDVEGAHVQDVWPGELGDALESAFQDALDGEMRAVEGEYARREWVIRVVPLTDDGDAVFGGMTLAQDITEQVDRQRKLEASNERLEQFAYAASHDLQEPLRMVSSYLRLLESRYSDELDEDGEEFLAYAVDGADRMRAMIDGLLEYSRVDTQGDPLEPIDLDCVFENALDNLQVRIEESNAEITAESLPRVRGDDNQLHQVFQNLLSNAIEYSGAGPPRISVDAERRGQKWLVSVHDDGIGIDPDDQERVFEVFQRLHSRDTHSGTGIGLALCQRIIERHGGRIWVDSEPDEGTTFSFTLPAAP
ncbi:PAS domain-containing protein [Halobacteria archaeon AArc-m2/3/4]|uniref:histidine kinase n=1 Tax=Natronoglomus mannanivorans TaxID=2979990 RepID=A0ABT2QCH9_9EURY|nr:PAS domain-containing protein [Halobacteria archaeon AArc-m2/3/4]